MGKNSAVFLDRDGVINIDQGYVHRREAFHFQNGIFELCQAAQRLGYLLVIITNQAGIGRGYYTESDFLELTDWMIHEFTEREIHIAHVYYCPYHPVHGLGAYKYDSPDRKPKPGMLLRAEGEFDLDLASSILIGDKLSDIYAAKAAGVGTTVLLSAEAAPISSDQYYTSDSLDDVRRRFFSAPSKAVGLESSSDSEPLHARGVRLKCSAL